MMLVGEKNPNRTFTCVRCGASLWGDNGVIRPEGAVCILENRCHLRQSRKQLDAMAAQGIQPRWR